MRIGEFYNGGYLVCWIDAEHFKPENMVEVIAHFKDAKYCDHDYCIGYYHENSNCISVGTGYTGYIDFSNFDYYMKIPPLPYRKERS